MSDIEAAPAAPVPLRFWLEEAMIADRRWWHVPRVGDHIMLTYKRQPTMFEIVAALWSDDDDAPELNAQRLDFRIDHAKTPVGRVTKRESFEP